MITIPGNIIKRYFYTLNTALSYEQCCKRDCKRIQLKVLFTLGIRSKIDRSMTLKGAICNFYNIRGRYAYHKEIHGNKYQLGT